MPAFLAIVLLASILSELVHYKFIQNIFWGVGIGVIVLLFLAVKEMWRNCVNDRLSSLIYIICLILALTGRVSPAYIIIFALAIGISSQFVKSYKEKLND